MERDRELRQIDALLTHNRLRAWLIADILSTLSDMSDNVIQTFRMKLQGYKQKAIAEALAVSEARVSTYISRNLDPIYRKIRLELAWKSMEPTGREPKSTLQLAFAMDAYGESGDDEDDDTPFRWTTGRVVKLKSYEKHARKARDEGETGAPRQES